MNNDNNFNQSNMNNNGNMNNPYFSPNGMMGYMPSAVYPGMPVYPYMVPQYMMMPYPMAGIPMPSNNMYPQNNFNQGFIDAQVSQAVDDVLDKVDSGKVTSDNSVINSEAFQKKVQEYVNEGINELNVSPLKKNYIVFDNVKKQYVIGTAPTIALDNVSFSIDEGELVVFLGHSGAGKTTALNMLGGMDEVTSGKVIVDGRDITSFDSEELTEYRRKEIGFVFQFYNLIQNLSAEENIELSTEISKDKIPAIQVLEEVGLKDCAGKFPNQLSGGEQQRVAIARALAKKPKILLCDEPTGALDYKTGKQILKLLQDTCRRNKITTVIITHNQAITPMADKVIYFNSGRIVGCNINPNPTNVEDLEW